MQNVGQATLQHLQTLQSEHLLEVPSACLGSAAGLPALSSKALFEGQDVASNAQLREMVRTAEFWISFLEGEHADLAAEVAKHRERHQLAQRQAEAKASTLREVEEEKTRLLAELKKVRQARDEANCAVRVLEENGKHKCGSSVDDVEKLAARAATLESQLEREREEKSDLESEFVRVKVRYAETLEKADSMEVVIQYYEDQLRTLNPTFEPVNYRAFGQFLQPARSFDAFEVESNPSATTDQQSMDWEEKPRKGHHKIKEGLTRMRKMFHHRKPTRESMIDAQKLSRHSTLHFSPRESVNSLPSLSAPRDTMNSVSRLSSPHGTVNSHSRPSTPQTLKPTAPQALNEDDGPSTQPRWKSNYVSEPSAVFQVGQVAVQDSETPEVATTAQAPTEDLTLAPTSARRKARWELRRE